MTTFSTYLTNFLTSFTLVADIFLVIAIIALCTRRLALSKSIITFLGRNAFWLSFLAALGAMLGSLLYSDVIGFEPCKLCWIQRIFHYPQVLLFAIALWKKDEHDIVIDYSIVLSILGALVAIYHEYLQLGGQLALTPCTAVGGACSKVFFVAYGYITIPMMSLTVFALLIVFMISKKIYRRENI